MNKSDEDWILMLEHQRTGFFSIEVENFQLYLLTSKLINQCTSCHLYWLVYQLAGKPVSCKSLLKAHLHHESTIARIYCLTTFIRATVVSTELRDTPLRVLQRPILSN